VYEYVPKKKEAISFLNSLKSNDKSFSVVIRAFKDKKGDKKNIMRLFGALRSQSIDWKEKETRMRSLRKSFEQRTGDT